MAYTRRYCLLNSMKKKQKKTGKPRYKILLRKKYMFLINWKEKKIGKESRKGKGTEVKLKPSKAKKEIREGKKGKYISFFSDLLRS